MALRKVQSGVIADNAITSAKIASGAVTAADLNSDVSTVINNVTVDTVFTGDSITIPAGTTAERPTSPTGGMVRYNTDTGLVEQYNSAGWQGIDSPPTVSSYSGIINENTNSTITIGGTNFKPGSVVYIEGAAVGGIPRALTTTYVSSISLTAVTNAGSVNYVGNGSYDVKVTNPSGLSATLSPAGTVDRDPIWSTGAGTLATIADEYGSYSPIATVSASDPDSTTITYSISSGSLPTNVTLNTSNGQISGNPSNVSSPTTYTFDITAASNNQSVPRTFSIIVNPALDGTSSARAATSASAIKTLTGTTTDGKYWLKPTGGSGTAFEAYCIMGRDGGGWVKALQFYNNTDMATSAAVNSGSTWCNSEVNFAGGKIANADWAALNTTNSFLMRVGHTANTPVFKRYWRYRVVNTIQGHHPRASRLWLQPYNSALVNVVTYVGDNCADSGTIPGNGETFSYDFGSPTWVVSAGSYVSYGGGTRNATIAVDYSDDNSNWTNYYTAQMLASSCGVIAAQSNSIGLGDNLFCSGQGTGKLVYSATLPTYGTDVDPTSNYSLYLDTTSNGSYEYQAAHTPDAQGRCNHTTNYWISDHNYNGSYVGTTPPANSIPQCWTIGTNRLVTNLHWMSGQTLQSGGSTVWGDSTSTSAAFFIK